MTEWTQLPPNTYRVRVWIERDKPDGCRNWEYTVFAADLPGIVSEGDTIDECLANIREAFCGAVAVYRDAGDPIPWMPGGEKPLFAEERQLLFEVPGCP